MMNVAVCIFGPTGVGKTSLAVELARGNGEIISVDSLQVYKYMNIGTAKPTADEQTCVHHHLIDIITPDQEFSAGDFKREAENLISKLNQQKLIPYLTGGTGLYFTALTRGMIDIPKIDSIVKQKIVDKHYKQGQLLMYKLLKKLDPEYAIMIHPNDQQRTLRALEVICGTKKKFSYYLKQENRKEEIYYINIGLQLERKKLYMLINQRIDLMIQQGLVNEVKLLLDQGYDKNAPGMQGIGYREIIAYLENKLSLAQAIELIKQNSRHYAKRQITWFKKINNVQWFVRNETAQIKAYINTKLHENGFTTLSI